jgi:hypothetical protein
MYDLTVNIDSESTGISYILPGINENVRLGKANDEYPIRYGVSKNNTEFVEFSFLNEEGQTFTHTEFAPTDEDDEKRNKKTANQIKRVRHILTKIVPEDSIKFKVETFKQFVEKVIEIVGDNYKGKLFRAKIVYNDRNYTTFPNYVPFMEKMEVEKEKSRLTISGDDKVVKTKSDPIRDDKNPFEIKEDDSPVQAAAKVELANDDLPF